MDAKKWGYLGIIANTNFKSSEETEKIKLLLRKVTSLTRDTNSVCPVVY